MQKKIELTFEWDETKETLPETFGTDREGVNLKKVAGGAGEGEAFSHRLMDRIESGELSGGEVMVLATLGLKTMRRVVDAEKRKAEGEARIKDMAEEIANIIGLIVVDGNPEKPEEAPAEKGDSHD